MTQGVRSRANLGGHGSVLFLSWRDSGHPDAGGAEVYLEQVVRQLAQRDWDVTIFTAAYDGGAAEGMVEGVHYIRRGGRFTVYLWGMVLYLLGRLGRHDVLVDVQNGLPFFASLWARRPVIVLNHHAHEEQWRIFFGPAVGRLGWWVESKLAPRLQRRARYVTVSDATRRDLERLGVDRSRMHVVHNGAAPMIAPSGGVCDHPRVMVLGRLVPHKRVELAIDAVARLRDRFPDLRLDVVGDGAWQDELEHHAASAGVGDLVTFHGHVDEATKARLLHRAWILALPSVKEGWGLVVTEAASLGVPTIAFRNAGGVNESIIDGQTGHLVRDHEEFTARLAQVLSSRAHRDRLGAAARLHSRSFSWNDAGNAFHRLLAGLVRQPAGR